jgi:hypothetical protein
VLRLFDSEMGAQASWLLPAALLLIVGLWLSRRVPRTDRTRAALLLWGGWLLVSAAVFRFGSGVIHTYYAVALVPAIAALIAIGGSLLWRERHSLLARAVAALTMLVTASWSWVLLDRTPQWESWMRVLIPRARPLRCSVCSRHPSCAGSDGGRRSRQLSCSVALQPQSAASLELATGGEPAMAIGGFNNEGGHLTLAEFERYVAAGDIHCYLASGGVGGGPGGGMRSHSTSSITSWVEAHFKSVKIGGQTVYDLTQARA